MKEHASLSTVQFLGYSPHMCKICCQTIYQYQKII